MAPNRLCKAILWLPLVLFVLEGCQRHPGGISKSSRPSKAQRSEFTLLVLGQPQGQTTWITTGNDQNPNNGQFDGKNFLFHTGSAQALANLETLLPKQGLLAGAEVEALFLSHRGPETEKALARLQTLWPIHHVVGVPNPGDPTEFTPHKAVYGKSLPGRLNLGSELTARVLPPLAEGLGAAGLHLRFVDMRILLLGDVATTHPEKSWSTFLSSIPPEHLMANLVIAPLGAPVHALVETAQPALWIGDTTDQALVEIKAHAHAVPYWFPKPKEDEALSMVTDGVEARGPGTLYRARMGHYLLCPKEGACKTTFQKTDDGPLLLELEIPRGSPGWFLLDTRSMHSYLTEKRIHQLPGNQHAHHHGHSHGGQATGALIPTFHLGSVGFHHWRVRGMPAAQFAGRPLAGVLGRDFLEPFRLEIKRQEGILSLENTLEEPAASRLPSGSMTKNKGGETYEVPMDWSPAGPLVIAKVDERQVSLVFATASRWSLLSVPWAAQQAAPGPVKINLAFEPYLRLEEDASPIWDHLVEPLRPLAVKNLSLRGLSFGNRQLWVPARALRTDLLGMDFLQEFEEAAFDFRGRMLTLKRRPQRGRRPRN